MQPPSVMFVHAHPDDESLWTGGTIARVVDQGSAVSVITCTWASGTHRHAELESALRILGAGSAIALGYADGGFPESAPDVTALCDCRFDDGVRRIVEQIRSFRPDIVITYDAYGIYGHPDHIQTHRLTLAAIEAAACAPLYPTMGSPWQVSSLYLSTVPVSVMRQIQDHVNTGPPRPGVPTPGTPDDAVDLSLDVSGWVGKKWAAITEHRTEIDRSAALKLLKSLDVARRDALLGTEWYLRRDLTPAGVDL